MPSAQIELTLLQVGLGFVATLVATLIGVKIAFDLDRTAESKKKKGRVIQHLNSLNKELSINREIATSNYRTLTGMQDDALESNHYALEPFNTDAWNAAIGERIIELVDESTHGELQEVYAEIRSINELIERVRTEPLYQGIGEEETVGPTDMTIWTIQINYWDHEADEVRETGLGDLILTRSQSLRVKIDSVSGEIDQEISKLEDESDDDESEPKNPGFNRVPAANYPR